jgi:PAS domain S-box-containing protein
MSGALHHDMESALADARVANQKLEAIIEASPLAIVTLDAAGLVKSWNPAAERIYGWTEEEVIDRPLPTVPTEMRAEMQRNHEAAVHGKYFSNYETVRVRKDGSTVQVSISTAPLLDADGNAVGVLALVADISERKRAEDALAFQSATLREQSSIIEQAYDAVILRDPSNAITIWNRGAERMYGFTQDEVRGRSPHELLATEFPAPLEEIYARLRRNGYWEGQLSHARKDGARITVESRWATLRDDAGEVTSILEINRDITERKRAEEALRVSETRFRALVEQSPLSTQVFSPDGLTVKVNRAWERLWGVTLAELPGYNILEDPQLIANGVTPYLRRAFAGEATEIPETAYVPDRGEFKGQERWVQARVYPVKDEAGMVTEVVLVHEDITARRHVEAERAQFAAQVAGERRRLKDLVANVPGVVWEAWGVPDESSQRINFVSDYVEEMLGYTVDEWLATPNFWLTIVHPEDQERAAREARAKFDSRKGGTSRFRWVRKDGRAIEVEAQSIIICDERGEPAGMRGVTMDITERTRAEARLFQLAAIIESSDDAIISRNLDGVIQSWNPAAERLYGYTVAEAVGQPVMMLIPHDRPDEETQIIERIKRGARVDHYETVRVRKDGARVNVSLTVSPVKDAQGRITGASKIARDITERTRAEEEQKFLSDATTVLASSLDYVSTLDAVAHMVTRYLADFCLVDLLEDDGTITRLIVAHGDPEREAAWREMQRRFPLDPAADYTIPRVLNTGESLLYSEPPDEMLERAQIKREQIDTLKGFGITSSMIVPLRARGRTLGAISFIAAESGRRYTERELRVAEEMARRAALAVDNARLFERAHEANRAKDEFLATLSHELRTPLTPIVGWVHLLGGGQINEPTDFKHGLAIIDKNSQTLSRLINDLLDMSAILNGKMRIDRAPVLISQVVREAVETVRAQADTRKVVIELTGCDEDNLQSMISGDRTRLVQVVWNLLTNAIKFSQDGGTVRVSCERDAASLVVSVEDEGIGIAPEFLPQVFDRFQQADMSTTKLYGGLGIGLALVHSFVEAHGGTVRAESDGLGRGSRFTVRLPVAELRNADFGSRIEEGSTSSSATASTATPAPASSVNDDQKLGAPTPQSEIRNPQSRSPQSTRRALIVEDAPDTLEMLRRLFEGRGFEVAACSEAAEALDVASRAHFDIIVTDIGLPNIDGYELLRRLYSESPHLAQAPAVALTGYAAEADVEAARAAGFDAHLAKPFEPATLTDVVEKLLARRDDAEGVTSGVE